MTSSTVRIRIAAASVSAWGGVAEAAQPSTNPPRPQPEGCVAVAHYRFENGAPESPALGPGTILDTVGWSHGTPVNGPLYRADVGATSIFSCVCEPNSLSLELNPGQSVRFDAPFIFHHPYADATLEFFVKPRYQEHSGLFWTRPDEDDRNRFNIAINSAGLGFDYRAPSGELHLTPAHNSILYLPVDTWSHVAIVRDTQALAPAHIYRFYVNGRHLITQIDRTPDLPDSPVWQVSGRAEYEFSGRIDDIRFTPRKLVPDEFAVGGHCDCYPDCDTSTGPGALDIFDFLCFQGRYAAHIPYACDCDTGTGAGICDVFDFLCFQNAYAAGCP